MTPNDPSDPGPPHEPRDASLRGILLGLGAVAALIVAGLLTASRLSSGQFGLRRPLPSQSFRHGPADVSDVERLWPEIERETHEHLETYGWIDRRAGVVRIPIERAMERLEAQAATAPVDQGEGGR